MKIMLNYGDKVVFQKYEKTENFHLEFSVRWLQFSVSNKFSFEKI